MIEIYHQKNIIANFQKENAYILEYKRQEIENSIALSLPNNQKFYIYEEFPPYFETFLPEGYLFEIFKNYLTKKFGYIDDYLLFELLAPNIEGRVSYKSENNLSKENDIELSIESILENDTQDTFSYLVETFFDKNAISGVQPKSVAMLRDKESLTYKNYIVKTWGEEFPYLAENEYLTMKTLEFSGIEIPNIHLSQNKRFLVVERFDSDDVGFEEVVSLMGKKKLQKYSGSYEQVAKVIYQYVSDPVSQMKNFFKLVVMNYLLKNGDAHLKNFGLVFSDNFTEIKLAPSYDIVTTTAYLFKDRPALTLAGTKIWHNRDGLLEFGMKSCFLKEKDAKRVYDESLEALVKGLKMLEAYITENPHFKLIGLRMLDSWKLSLSQRAIKEMPDELVRTWR